MPLKHPGARHWLRRRPSAGTKANATDTFYGNPGGRVQFIIIPPVRVPHVFTDTDEFVGAAVTIVDEEDYIPSPPWKAVPYNTPVNDEDHGALLGGFRINEDYLWAAQFLPLVSNRQPLVDTDEQSFIYVDEDYWQATAYVLSTVNRQPTPDTDELRFIVAFGLDEEFRQQILPQRRLDFPPSAFTDDDTYFVVATPFFLDEDYWVANRGSYPVPPAYMVLFIIQGEGDSWVPFVPPPPAQPKYIPHFRPRRR